MVAGRRLTWPVLVGTLLATWIGSGSIFGGGNLDTLYVTSATQRIDPEVLAKQPLAGGLFAVHVGVKGLPEAAYAG